MRSDLRVMEKSARALKYVSVRGLGVFSLRDVTGRMVDHPWRATGPLISLPVVGSRPMKLHAGSCSRRMSKSVGGLFSN